MSPRPLYPLEAAVLRDVLYDVIIDIINSCRYRLFRLNVTTFPVIVNDFV